MGFIFGLLLLFLFVFIIWPLLRAGLLVYKARKQMRDLFGGGARKGGARRQEQQPPQQPPRRRKKIDPNVGEYVEFEEIKTYTQSSGEVRTETSETGSSGRTVTEEQIEDAEWEDIKP